MVYNQGLEGQSRPVAMELNELPHSNGLPIANRFRVMNEKEYPLIRITENDIAEANQLSLSCPICGNAVENHADGAALLPVVCDKCGTLYHKACWERSGGKCAVLGCGSDKFHIYGKSTKPVLKVKYTDLPAPSPNGRPSAQTRRLKEEQRRQVQRMTLFQRFWRWLLDQIKINP
jgi:hypothetical protein